MLKKLLITITATTAPDTKAPEIISTSPSNNATDVEKSKTIVFTFSENIEIADASKISLLDKDGKAVEFNTEVTENKLTIKAKTDLSEGVKYTVKVESGAVKDEAGNSLKDSLNVEFTTKQADKPNNQTSQTPNVNGDIYTSTTAIKGTAGSNAKIILTVDGNEIANTTADENGNWSVKIDNQKNQTVIKVIAREDGKLDSEIKITVTSNSSSSSSGSSSSGGFRWFRWFIIKSNKCFNRR